jgi:dihydrofolate reductase
MEVLLYMAMSANGFIAGENWNEGFLSHYNWIKLCQLVNEHGNLIWGRKTYEAVRTWGSDYFTEELRNARKVIISTHDIPLDNGYVLAHSPREALSLLKNEGFDTAILTGGSTINASFAMENLIDEVLLNIEPVLIGSGTPLFARTYLKFPLQFQSLEKFETNGLSLHYKVQKNRLRLTSEVK